MSYTSTTGQSGTNNATSQNTLASLLAVSDATSGFGTTTQPVVQTANDASTYSWLAGWIIFIAILALLAQSKAGYSTIYYSLVLVILVLVGTQYQRIANMLASVGTEIPQ
jgi:hypothetical protein